MAKIRVVKKVEPVKNSGSPAESKPTTSGPGGRILSDKQIEDWSQFAEKNQKMNFDQKWDAFSKMNPKFGATKKNVRDALDAHERWITDQYNKEVESGKFMGTGAKHQFGAKQTGLMTTGDVFTPLYDENKKLIGRHTETGELSSLYPKRPDERQQYLGKIFKQPNKIPNPGQVNLDNPKIDLQRGIAIFEYDGGGEFSASIEDLLNIPEYNQSLRNVYRDKMVEFQQSKLKRQGMLNK